MQKKQDIRLLSALCSKGKIYFDSFSQISKTKYLVNDYKGIAYIYLSRLYEKAKELKINCTVSFSPDKLSSPDGIFFPDTNTSFSVYSKNADHIINCQRFADKSAFSQIKQKLSFISKTAFQLKKQSFYSLSEAAENHDLIEKIYYPFTDYSVTEKITDNLCQDIFG